MVPRLVQCLRECLGADLDSYIGLLVLEMLLLSTAGPLRPKSMTTCSNLHEAILRKDQIPAGIQVVLSKHWLLLSSLRLQYGFCIASQTMQGALFFIYTGRVIG